MADTEHRQGGHCPRCGGTREATIDRKTGRYLVLLPSSCETKDQCEADALHPFKK